MGNDALFFEDFHVGQVFAPPAYTITQAQAIAFAREFDPQAFHIDAQAASNTAAGRLIVSGWHTAAICMRLKAGTDLGRIYGGLLGLGSDKLRWPQPVYPHDTLRLVITIIAMRPSLSKPSHGVITYTMEAFNQHDALVYTNETSVWVPRQ